MSFLLRFHGFYITMGRCEETVLDKIRDWTADFMEANAAMPTHLALTAKEESSLMSDPIIRDVRAYTYKPGVPFTIYGMEIETVGDGYSGVRVWSSKPDEPLKHGSYCGSCGASWLPECNYCGRIG